MRRRPTYRACQDGELLAPAYGAPARFHSPFKLGYENTKYLTRILFLPKGYGWYGGV